jgi:cytochrome c553
MQNKPTLKEKLDEVKGVQPKVEIKLNSLLENKLVAWMLLVVAFLLMFIENFLKMNELVGGWHILFYLLLITPLAYMAWNKKLVNPYTKWLIPMLLVMIVDMFFYSNELVQYVVPLIFYFLVVTLYLTSMQKVHSFYQTLLLRFELPWYGLRYIKTFLSNLFIKNDDRKLYFRIALALMITLPFLGVFVALLFSADKNFGDFLTHLFSFNLGFSLRYIWTVPLYFILFLLLFIYGFSNHKERNFMQESSPLDILIVGIFLGAINLLFAMFVMIQLPFIFGEPHLPEGINLAEFAREGFFQLMMVMGIVLLIFLFIMRRFKGEKVTLYLLAGLLIQTIIMGIVSLKKMYLYQSIKGATVMRYYVEWFDYFLLLVLVAGFVFLFRALPFKKLLNLVAVLGLFAFTLVISLNVEAMVASHNIEKFKGKPYELDRYALSQLSIDALPAIQGSKVILEPYWKERDCSIFRDYHFGYCSNLATYGTTQYKSKIEEKTLYSDDYGLDYSNQDASKIYESCAGCHGLDGEQKALGKSAPIGGQDTNKTFNQLRAYKLGELNLYGMGNLMKGQVNHLSEESMREVALYIAGLKTTTGERNESN